MTLAAFVAGFDIEGIGETSVEKLVEAGFDSLEKLLSMKTEEAASVYGFADITAKIVMIENLGKDTIATMEYNNNNFKIYIPTNGLYVTGGFLGLRFNRDRIFIFDKSGNRLINSK